MEKARLSAKRTELKWGLAVSVFLRVLARERRKEMSRVGLLGLLRCWAKMAALGLFHLFACFSFSDSIF